MSHAFATTFDHAATDPNVDPAVIQTQLATAAALRSRLDARGGAILGDEVGAGKTFVSFALIAELLLREPKRGVVIFVPNRLLVHKWSEQLRDYLIASIPDRTVGHNLAGRIHEMDRTLCKAKPDAIVITTHTVYSYRTSTGDQGACLRAALQILPEGRGRHHKSVLKAFGLAQHSGDFWPSWAHGQALNKTTLKPLAPQLQRYCDGERGLQDDMRAAVQEIRRLVGRSALPDAGLVIIDEAHNLKSTSSAIYRALMGVLDQRFDALLFLTATPFQLGRHELLTIIDFFKASRLSGQHPAALADQRQALSDAMDGHVDALARFGASWRDLTVEQVAQTRAVIAGTAAPCDALSADVEAAFHSCVEAKVALETTMRPFVVRSVRVRDHHETGRVDDQFVTQQARIPLALVDRLLVEIMQEGRTFISSALIGACSSWPALREAAIMRADGRAPSTTRDALRELGERGLLGGHPKVEQTVAAVIDAVGRGEKTLVFVERDHTGEELQRRIKAELEKQKAEDLSSAEAQLQALQAKTRFGWPSLRENYLSTIFPMVFGRGLLATDIDRVWIAPAVQQLWARCDIDNDRHDHAIEKRFWEHVLFADAVSGTPGWRDDPAGTVVDCVERILEPDFILNGLDLVSGASKVRLRLPPRPVRSEYRDPSLHFARALAGFRSPWWVCAERLEALAPDHRAALVDAAASAIAKSHFRAQIAAIDTGGDPARHFAEVDRLLLDEDGLWPTRFRALAQQAADAVRTSDPELADRRMQAVIDSLSGRRADDRVVYVSGATGPDTRQRAVDGFNTPLYPEVLIATPVLGEGIDLHRFCRRVIHHDLPWNPAKLEQRTGRVDRVGSLAERMRRDGDGRPVPIEVAMPFVPGTYDEFVHDRVLARRREFRCLLGNRPEWKGDGELGDDETGPPVAEELVAALQVDLSPLTDDVVRSAEVDDTAVADLIKEFDLPRLVAQATR